MRTLVHRVETFDDGSYTITHAHEVLPPFQLWQVRWDDELDEYNYLSRTADEHWGWGPFTPAVFRYFPVMKADAGDFRVNLETVEAFTREINPTDKLWDYYAGHSAGVFNTHDVQPGETSGWPKQMSIIMSGNYVKELEVIGTTWLKFETLTVPQMSPIGAGTLHLTHPWHVHHWALIGYNRYGITVHSVIVNPGIVHYPVVCKEGYGYIQQKYVKRVVQGD